MAEESVSPEMDTTEVSPGIHIRSDILAPVEHTPPNHGKSIAEKVWDRLDKVVLEINEARRNKSSCVLATIRAEELAWMLVLVCQPYYLDTKAVSREAAKRAKMEDGSIAWEPTPGYRYNPPPVGTTYPTTNRRGAAPATPKAAPPIPAAKRAAIVAAMNMGLPSDALASAYGVTVAQLDALQAELDK